MPQLGDRICSTTDGPTESQTLHCLELSILELSIEVRCKYYGEWRIPDDVDHSTISLGL